MHYRPKITMKSRSAAKGGGGAKSFDMLMKPLFRGMCGLPTLRDWRLEERVREVGAHFETFYETMNALLASGLLNWNTPRLKTPSHFKFVDWEGRALLSALTT